MPLVEKAVPAAPVPEAIALPKDIPMLPEDMLKRFPTMGDWYDSLMKDWWQKVRAQFFNSQDVSISATNDALNKANTTLTNIVVISGGFTAAITAEQIARIDGDTALASSITAVIAAYTSADTSLSASITTEQTARIAADSAEATLRSSVDATLTSGLASANASITAESTARATADSAEATTRAAADSTLTTSIGTVAASVSTEASTRATADTALSSSISTVSAAVVTAQNTANSKIKTFIQSGTPTASETGDLWVDTGSGYAVKRWDGSSWVDTTVAAGAIGIVAASVTTESTARATADTALASSITTVTAAYIAADATITASVTTEATARASADGAIHAMWGVAIDIGGNIVGRINLDGTNQSSTFLVAVDHFQVTNANGTITLLDINTSGKIVFGTDVQSDNFVAGSSGWEIQRNSGDAEFNSIIIRNTIILWSLAAPVLSQGTSTFSGTLTVTATGTGTIRYTTDGSEVLAGSTAFPGGGLAITSTSTLRVRSFSGSSISPEVTAVYSLASDGGGVLASTISGGALSSGTMTGMYSLTVTTGPGLITISWEAYQLNNGSGSGNTPSFQLKRNGSIVKSWTLSAMAAGGNQPVTLTWDETPGAGSQTYDLEGSISGGPAVTYGGRFSVNGLGM